MNYAESLASINTVGFINFRPWKVLIEAYLFKPTNTEQLPAECKYERIYLLSKSDISFYFCNYKLILLFALTLWSTSAEEGRPSLSQGLIARTFGILRNTFPVKWINWSGWKGLASKNDQNMRKDEAAYPEAQLTLHYGVPVNLLWHRRNGQVNPRS